jgi:hypothetical protein
VESAITFENLAAEIARKRAELKELEELLRLAEKYLRHAQPVRVTGVGAIGALAMLAQKERNAASFGATKKDRILNGCEFVLSDGKRRISRQLVIELAEHGIRVGGENPGTEAANLSSYLSREKDRFVSDVKLGGWTLRRLLQKGGPENVGASSGPYINAT